MPGPPREPVHLKILKGNPGHKKLRNEPAPTVPPIFPEPPPHITGYAADEWWESGPSLHAMGMLTVLDMAAFACYCHAFGQWRMAAESLAKMQANDLIMNAQIIKTKYGDAAANPLVSIVRKHAGDVVRFASEFGMSAASRSRISAGVNAPSPPSKWDGLLGGRVLPMKRGDG